MTAEPIVQPILVVRDPRFREHRGAPGHPERPERLLGIERALARCSAPLLDVAPREASDDEIVRVHDPEYLRALAGLEGRAAQLDPDTYLAPASYRVARLAAGSTTELALRIARGEAKHGFALIRPPGHHAERGRAMGFCLFNQVAIAARALASQGLERVAIVDWDVHHGNGTQHSFESDRDVLFISTHQFPYYPGTGALRERGVGAGQGATLNLPLPATCGDAEYLAVFESVVVPALREFRPDMIVVSAGFDAHELDPLGHMNVSTAGFAELARKVRAVADEHCQGRMLLALEGGYDEDALGASVSAVLEVLAEEKPAERCAAEPGPRAEQLVELFREAHGHSFRSLRARVHG
jgi:acetoin utilization deacetylase AcuC-like enzyme